MSENQPEQVYHVSAIERVYGFAGNALEDLGNSDCHPKKLDFGICYWKQDFSR